MRYTVVSMLVLLCGPFAQSKSYTVFMEGKEAFASVDKFFGTSSKAALGNHQKICPALLNYRGQRVQTLKNLHAFIIESTESAALQLESCAEVQSVQPESYSSMAQSSFDHTFPGFKGPDWNLKAIHVEEAWKKTRGKGVKIMVLDGEVKGDHPEFKGRFYKERDFLEEEDKAGGVGNKGLPTVPAGDQPDDKYFKYKAHGSHVSGIALGHSVGVAPEALLLSAKVCDDETRRCSGEAIYKALDWAISEKVDVVNMSFASIGLRNESAFKKVDKAGILMVGASGNSGLDVVFFPAAFPIVIAVGAIDKTGWRVDGSQYGKRLDIMAPGVHIRSSVSQRVYESKLKVSGPEGFIDIWGDSVQGATPVAASVEADFIDVGLGLESDVTKSIKGKVALISRGEITFREKVLNVMSHGAVGAIIYNDKEKLEPKRPMILDSKIDIPVILIGRASGQEIKEKLLKGEKVKGVIETSFDFYSLSSGTSMAVPHVSGVLALMKSANPHLTVDQAKDILFGSAMPIRKAEFESKMENGLDGSYRDEKKTYKFHYGHGLVNAAEAVNKSLEL